MVGWINTKMFDETGDIAKSQGWTALILDTNGNGKRDEYVEPNQPVDPHQGQADRRGLLRRDAEPGGRLDLGLVPELIRGPSCASRRDPIPRRRRSPRSTMCRCRASAPRGADIDSQGVVWVSLASGHLGSFDRRKCKGPLNGPKATGDHCPEGWSFYQYPGPGFQRHR